MFNNYLSVALRNLLNNKLFSLLNIIGLSIGIAISMLISSFVVYEHSYDKFFSAADRTYRISRHYAEKNMHLAAIAAPFATLIKTRISGVEAISQLGMSSEVSFKRGDVNVIFDDILLADSDIFSVLPLIFVRGQAEHSLDKSSAIVLTESAAKRLFGAEDAIGQWVLAYDQYPVEVTGIIKDLPANSHLKFSVLMSLEGMRNYVPEDFKNWDFNNFYTYLRLTPDTNKQLIEQKLAFVLAEMGEEITSDQSLELQAIGDIHLYSHKVYEMKTNGSYLVVYSFSAIALVILLIGCMNFMNLSSARASTRAKEVALRKTLGASRAQLIGQFLLEANLVALVAMVLAFSINELSMPWFAHFIDRPVTMGMFYQPLWLLGILMLALVVGCLSGSYPAFYLSAFTPAEVLKGQLSGAGNAATLRKIIVVTQFSISITLIIATLVVVQQTHYARAKDPGYSTAGNVIVSLSSAPGYADKNSFYRTFRTLLLKNPTILSVTAAQQLPTMALRDIWSYVIEGKNISAENMVSLPTLNASFDYFEHHKIPLLAGRTFSETHGDPYVQVPTDAQPIGHGVAVISRSAAHALGFEPEQAVDKIIKIPFPPGSTNYRIVGVVEDIQLGSLREEQKPQVYHLVKNEERFISINITAEDIKSSLAYIDSSWEKLVPSRAIKRNFLSENIYALYQYEDKQANIILLFAALAIAVASMGLLGLAVFSADRRKKEIAIRKVMGASISSLVLMLTKEFTGLILIANVFAWPCAYFMMNYWLQGFSAHISLNLWTFISAGAAALIIAWLTLAVHASHSAMSRPVTCLRYE